MMTNREIAKYFDLLAKLMELHEENPFKIRSYRNAYNILRQINDQVVDLDEKQLLEIPGIGKAIAKKIIALRERGTFDALEKMLEKTPPGILDLLKLKGLGPKKIRMIWKELGVESLGELEYAIKENRLTLLKGFGEKTQNNILKQILFLESVKGNYLFYKIIPIADELIKILTEKYPDDSFSLTGNLRRYYPVVSSISIVSSVGIDIIKNDLKALLEFKEEEIFYKNIKIHFIKTISNSFGLDLFVSTGPELFVEKFKLTDYKDENLIFEDNNIPYIPPVFRDNDEIINNPGKFDESEYIHLADIKGIIHNHTVWSDGSDSVFDLANYCKEKGYRYLVVSDHSKSAFYANGLKQDQIRYYLEDIAEANSKLEGFKIFSGIESDILNDGSLDYDEEILSKFDVVIASIHSGLRMEKEKATKRILKAIENPFTRIIGHVSGRILLAREGYPLDYDTIFQACVEHDVVIELNANPHRLDIDWKLIAKAQDMGVKFSINPDAHAKQEVDYLKYGVLMAQKGGVLKENCLNIKSIEEFEDWVGEK